MNQIQVVEELVVDYLRHTRGDAESRRLLRERDADPTAAVEYAMTVVDVLRAYLRRTELHASTVRHFGFDVPAEVPDTATVEAIVAHGPGVFVRFNDWRQELAV